MKKLLAFALSIFMITQFFSACTSQSERIIVTSSDYASLKYLEPGDFDEEQSIYWNLLENPYCEYTCSVSISDGMLFISNYESRQKSYLTLFDNGYFCGVDLGEFDGWVKYYPYHSTYPEAGETILVSTQNCRGIIAKDRKNGYLLTGEYGGPFGEYHGSIYNLHYLEDEKKWEWNLLKSINELPLAFSYEEDQDILYIVTSGSIISVSSDCQVTMIITSDLLSRIGANSIVYYDSSFWCRSPMGVYRYCIENEEEIWYPMDYKSHVN